MSLTPLEYPMHTVQPKKDTSKIVVTFRPPVRMPHAGKGQSTRFGNWRKASRSTSKAEFNREH